MIKINHYYQTYGDNYIFDLDPSIKINDFINNLNLTEQEWLVILLSLEIDFKINLPKKYKDNTEITIEAFCQYLSLLPIEKNNNWTLNRIKNLINQVDGDNQKLINCFFSDGAYA